MKPPPLPAEVVFPAHIVCLITMMARLAKADGAVTQAELNVIDSFFTDILKLDNEKRQSAVLAFRTAKNSTTPWHNIVTTFSGKAPREPGFRLAVVELLLAIALADGELSDKEDMLLSELVSNLHIPDNAYTKFKQEQKRQDSERKRSQDARLSAALSVLGLDQMPSRLNLKKAYRELVVQCHPDRNHHLPERLRRLAEEEMKKINDAYAYLDEHCEA